MSSEQHLAVTSRFARDAAVAYVGCAGWSIASDAKTCFSTEGSVLSRYSKVMGAVEINSSFYRPHKTSTYARWAAEVPEHFRFSVKLPKQITHTLRLSGIEQELTEFAGQVGALENKLGCILVQLPPSFSHDAEVADVFFSLLRQQFTCMFACEARHTSWFSSDASNVLETHAVTRVEADPLLGQTGSFEPTTPERYLRLHGSPKMYYSSYSTKFLAALRTQLNGAQHTTWVIFDNSASGASTLNALSLRGECKDV